MTLDHDDADNDSEDEITDDRFADDDFDDDDDLEFKPASAPPKGADSAVTSTDDDNEVPSLLFSDDPQAGDR